MVQLAFFGAPALMFCYGIARYADGADNEYGPGPAWTVGHLCFLACLGLFAVVIAGLRQLAPVTGRGVRIVADVATAAGFLGIIAFARVVVIDLIVGFKAANHAAMHGVNARYKHSPSVLPSGLYDALHNLGPLFFALGLIVLLVQIARSRPRGLITLSPVLIVLGFVMLGADLALLPVAAVVLALAVLPAIRRVNPRPAGAPGRAMAS